MAISFFSKDLQFSISQKIKMVRLLRTIIKKEKKQEGAINFTFCSDTFLLDINKKFLKHSTLTDVITFQYPSPKLSGEIFISIPRIKENAIKFDVPHRQELQRVIIHGVLHLCGYKDKKPADKIKMKKKEDYYLNMVAVK